jgi:zinc and cadmium transporter
MLGWILLSVFVVSLISFIGAFTLAINDKLLKRMLTLMVSFAAGGMLAATFLDILPEALDKAGIEKTMIYTMLGIAIFFVVEKFLYWYHCHSGACHHENMNHHFSKGHKHLVAPMAYLNLAGDSVHNFLDGMVIAVAYVVNWKMGIIVTLGVIFHEIPQEIGDFSVLIYAGLTKARALFYNFLIALTAVVGALVGYYFGELDSFTSYMLPIAAGNFLYIALSDLMPELHIENSVKRNIGQLAFFMLGIVIIWVLTVYVHA